MKNLEIAQILYHIADMLELQEVPFKPQAYRNAARTIENLSEDIEEVHEKGELENLPAVGKSIAEKIAEFLDKGRMTYYTQLKKEVGVDIEQLLRIPTLGPKRIKLLSQKLKIKTIADLEKAVKNGKLRTIPGFGEESEKHILQGIELLKSHPLRFTYAQAVPIVQEMTKYLLKSGFAQKVEIAGSFRRGKETVGDLDFLVISKQPEKVTAAFISHPDVKEVLTFGSTKSSVRLGNGMQVDLRVVGEKELGSALLYFIGNKEHNIELRKLALSKGYTLSEYGLFKLKGKKWIAGKTEQDVYDKLGLKYMEPELRENTGELQVSLKNKLSKLVTVKDINGVFHNHSDWTDGKNTMLEMAQKAEAMKLKFISFNDHYSSIGIINPLTEKRMLSYLTEIEKVRKKVGIKIFSGIEIDIQRDGSLLPISKFLLKELDVVVAAVHTSLGLPEAEMTARICKALENNPINILAHPTCVRYGEREGIAVNLERIFETAKRNNVFMEINSTTLRMDLNGINTKAAIEHGCKLSIGTDAHTVERLETYPFGVLCARRGWAEKKDVLNCWELKKIEKGLER